MQIFWLVVIIARVLAQKQKMSGQNLRKLQLPKRSRLLIETPAKSIPGQKTLMSTHRGHRIMVQKSAFESRKCFKLCRHLYKWY